MHTKLRCVQDGMVSGAWLVVSREWRWRSGVWSCGRVVVWSCGVCVIVCDCVLCCVVYRVLCLFRFVWFVLGGMGWA